jgi:TonB-dependent SusC/RagA subfamily outer membrane receptor
VETIAHPNQIYMSQSSKTSLWSFQLVTIQVFLLIILSFSKAYAQKDEVKNILIQRLEQRSLTSPQEKVHLHLDKNIYSAGDTVWFAGYVVNAIKNIPTNISSMLYVELINDKNQISMALQLPIHSGFTDGDLALPDSLTEGTYHLRAYTNLMRNADYSFFFTKDLYLLNGGKRTEKAVIKPVAINYDVQFFPESGNLINGLNSTVAFKAVDQTGKGVAVNGYLVDEQQKTITEFTSAYAGMGSFKLKPLENKTYTAVVKLPDGTEKKIPLAAAQKSGYTIIANNESKDSLQVTLQATPDLVNAETMTFMPLSNGVPLFYMETKFPDKQINISIPKNRALGGILQLSLLNSKNEPIAERLVFNPYTKVVKMNASGLKPIYQKREKAEMDLQAGDVIGKPLNGSFSVAIVNEDELKNENQESTIFSNLLLNSDLKGYIENPNYYFTDPTDTKNKELDNLMLSQGWSRFSWKDVVENNQPGNVYPREDHIKINGQISTKSKAAIAGIPVTLLAGELISGALLDTLTNDQGQFTFNLSDSLKELPIRLQVKGKKGVEYEINLDQYKSATIDQKMDQVFLEPSVAIENYRNALIQGGKIAQPKKSIFDKAIKLKDVEIKDYNPRPKLLNSHSANLNGPGQADKVVTSEVLEKMLDLTSLDVLLVGVRRLGLGRFRLNSSAGMAHTPDVLVLIDGTEGIFKTITEISPRDVESIEFLKSPEYIGIYGIRGSGGVILITTKKGSNRPYDSSIKAANSLTFNLPFQTKKEFYVPKYDTVNGKSKSMDLRSTIFWKPNLITDQTGKASFNFYNNDVAGNYKMIIEGISAKGELCRQVYSYKIE